MAMAQDWGISVAAGSPDGTHEGIWGFIGAMSDAEDGVDMLYEDGLETDFYGEDTTKWIQPVPEGASTCYNWDLKSTASYDTYPDQQKKWPLRAATLNAATTDGLRMYFITTDGLLPETAPPGNDPWGYYLRLVNSQSMAITKPAWAGGGAWAEGEMIPLTIPAAADTIFGEVLLPDLVLPSGATGDTLYAMGYQFEFIQGAAGGEPIPEPSSLMALGAGFAGLMGFVSRKRRA